VNTGDVRWTLRASNAIGGLQAGLQLGASRGPICSDLEADISGTDISSTALTSPPGDPSAVAQWNDKVEQRCFGTARARLGYIAGPWLFYATGGFGWAVRQGSREPNLSAPFFAGAPFCRRQCVACWGRRGRRPICGPAGRLALGVEWAFARTWTAKLEYLHIDHTVRTHVERPIQLCNIRSPKFLIFSHSADE